MARKSHSYERFLNRQTVEILPYFGGPSLDAPDRRLRLAAPIEPGFWRFDVRGRMAHPLGPAPRPALDHLAALRGHVVDDYLLHRQSRAERLELCPQEVPALFAPVVARRWPSGEIIFELVDFETGREEWARRAYEERRPFPAMKGAPPSLRAAFGYAVIRRVAAERRLPVVPGEVRRFLGRLAEADDQAACQVLDGLRRERALDAVGDRWRVRCRPAGPVGDAAERAEAALHAAGAALLVSRRLADGLLEVCYRYHGERFVSVVDERTLQVVDAGICLAGADRLLRLESLPSVIREAIREDRLVITRWA